MRPLLASILLLLAAAAPNGATMPAKPPPPTPVTQAYRDAFTTLQLDMNIRYTGDPDQDFATLAAAQAKALAAVAAIENSHGSDPALRAIAERLHAQSRQDEADLRAWRAAHKAP